MKKHAACLLLLIGALMLGLGLLLLNDVRPAFAQDPPVAEYVGASSCASCHRDIGLRHSTSSHALALQDVREDKSAIRADFEQGAALRTVTFPEESAPRPFTKEDISYLIGSGRYTERYVYRIARDRYAILPAEWNVAAQQWQPYRADYAFPEAPELNWATNCGGCHVTGLTARGRWRDLGVQCEACHGPGSLHVEAAERIGRNPSDQDRLILRSTIHSAQDSQSCGQCHAAGSVPDSGLPYPTDYRPGGDLLAPAVFTLVANDSADHWWASGHAKAANMQFNEWQQSAHAKADVTCVSCHNPHLQEARPFNLRDAPYALCTSCHSDADASNGLKLPNQQMFEGITLISEVEGIPSPHFTAENKAECATCHMPNVPMDGILKGSHTQKVILPTQAAEGTADSCTGCHTTTTAEALKQFVDATQNNTRTRLARIRTLITANTPAWITTAADFVANDGSSGVHNQRYTAALLFAAEKALGLADAGGVLRAPSEKPIVNPNECAECHQEIYAQWLTSPHARASLSETFVGEYARLNQPSMCMGCHASGYDSKTGSYAFEGVICSTCHTVDLNAPHPPGTITRAESSAACGTCHSGAHAPSYNEWLTSAHSAARIDCINCHTPHNNGLVMGDVNTTCANCHKDAAQENIHMTAEQNCADCHMRVVTDNTGYLKKTGHTMAVEAGACATCHGDLHAIEPRPRDGELSRAELERLQGEVARLEVQAQETWLSGLLGGVLGMAIIGAAGFIILRRGRRQ
jgi:predicted CXXCH cytochrome family protein